MSEAMLEEFGRQRRSLEALGTQLHARLSGLLREAGVALSFVSWRLKDPSSLARKLSRPEKSYRALWDVTDLIGLRVATSFEDGVEDVARLVETHYAVDLRHSVDRRRPAGYRSIHYVCGLPDAPHPDFRFEVQVRTALQHAWAEVEHDLGYKSDDPVPEPIRRRFARVASLLELADQELVSIRGELLASRQAAARTLQRPDADLPLDLLSLEALITRPQLEAVDRAVASALERALSSAPFFPDYLVSVLRLSGLQTTGAVQAAVDRFAADVVPALAPYFTVARSELGFTPEQLGAIERGYGLLFVAHLHVIRGPGLSLGKVSRLTRLYQTLELPDDEARAHRVASALIAALS